MRETMRAAVTYEGRPVTGPDCLVDVELPVPQLRPREVLVRVQTVSVNTVDVERRLAWPDLAWPGLAWPGLS